MLFPSTQRLCGRLATWPHPLIDDRAPIHNHGLKGHMTYPARGRHIGAVLRNFEWLLRRSGIFYLSGADLLCNNNPSAG